MNVYYKILQEKSHLQFRDLLHNCMIQGIFKRNLKQTTMDIQFVDVGYDKMQSKWLQSGTSLCVRDRSGIVL